MSLEITSPQPAKRPGSGLYVVAWTALGLAALGYLAALAFRPDLVTEHLPVLQPSEPEGNQGQRAMSKALAEVKALKDSVSQVQLDVAKLKAEQAGSDERQKALSSRLATVEEKMTVALPPVASAGPPAVAQPKQGQVAAPAPSPATALSPATVAAEAARAKETVAAGMKGADALGGLATGGLATSLDAGRPGIETGSLAAALPATAIPRVINAKPQAAAEAQATAAAAAKALPQQAIAPSPADPVPGFGAAVVKPAAQQPVGLRISSGPSLDALRLSWSLLSDRHTSQLKALEPRYVTREGAAGAGDAAYDLIAGPVKSEAEAKRICKVLGAKNVPCEVGTFGGNAL